MNKLILCKCILHVNQSFARSVDHLFHVCVLCFVEWPLLFSLSERTDEKWVTVCRSHYLVILSPLVHTQPEKSVKFILRFWQRQPFWWNEPGIYKWPTLFSWSSKICNSSLVGGRGHYSSYLASALKVQIALLGRRSCCCYFCSDQFPVHL